MGVRSALEGKLRTTAADAYSSVGCALHQELLELDVVCLGLLGWRSLVRLGLFGGNHFV